jgi:maltose alpha-D-glucosyltransferase/alpha-amylase
MRRKKNHRLCRISAVTDFVCESAAPLQKAREDIVNAPQQAKETYHELRKTLPPLLASYLADQRWFGGKARQIRSTEITDLVPLGNARLETFVLLARIEYATGPGETYVLPMICSWEPAAENATASLTVHSPARGTNLHLRNALTNTEFLRSLLETIEQKAAFRGVEGEIHAACTSLFNVLCGDSTSVLQPRPIKAEQSNTSIIYGDRVILKFFRRGEEGENPDLEIGRFLTEKKNFPHIPAVAGWLHYKGRDGKEMSLGILQAFVPNVGDAWQFTLNALSSFWKEAREYSEGHLGRVPQHDGPVAAYGQSLPTPVLDHLGLYLDAVHLLGKRTAELHLALASEQTDPAFAPEPYTASFQRAFKESVQTLTERNLALLRMKLHELPPELREKAKNLIARQGEILQKYEAALASPIQAMRTRIHGDYHLGQVLYTGSDFVIIDFEGEPARPISERRVKRSPLQDVAGMLRSFHYAAFFFQLAPSDGMTTSEMNDPEVRAWAERWYACVADRFLSAYYGNVAGACFIPPNQDELSALLQLHLLDKAVYELGYELNNRPAWIAIPLEGISRLLTS